MDASTRTAPLYTRRLGPAARARLLAQGGRLGTAKWQLQKMQKTNSIYEAVEVYLLLRGGWADVRSARRSRSRPHLQIGGWCATGVDFDALDLGRMRTAASSRKNGYSAHFALQERRERAGDPAINRHEWWLTVQRNFRSPRSGEWVESRVVGSNVPLINFYRGFELLCRKDEQVCTFREARIEHVAPDSYIFDPLRPTWSEAAAFALAFGRHARKRHRRERWERRERAEGGGGTPLTPTRSPRSRGAPPVPMAATIAASPSRRVASRSLQGAGRSGSRGGSRAAASASAAAAVMIPLLGTDSSGGAQPPPQPAPQFSPARGGGGVLRAARGRRSAAQVDAAKRKKRAEIFARDENRLDVAARKLERALLAGRLRSVWILKPAEGQCGQSIEVLDSLDAIFARLAEIRRAALEHERLGSNAAFEMLNGKRGGAAKKGKGKLKKAAARRAQQAMGRWVLQKYIERPLLMSGRRKFDIRAWVLVTANYDVLLYREGVLRTGSVPFSLDNLTDRFVHLTNHCIQTKHADFGAWPGEPTNELWWGEFDRFLIENHGAEYGFYRRILPQIRATTATCFGTVHGKVGNHRRAKGSYVAFQLFGLDLMIDEAFKVHLIEINSSPAVAADLMPAFVEDLVHVAIDPLFPLERLDGAGVDSDPSQSNPDWWLEAQSPHHFHHPEAARAASQAAARYVR